MPERLPHLLGAWLLLILIGGAEFGVSFVPMPPPVRPVLLVFAAAMLATVAIAFMRIGSGPVVVRGFVAAGVFWLIVLIGLGSMDPLTRTDYHVQEAHPQ